MKLSAGHFYGKTSRAFTAGGFRFTEKIYPTHAKLPPHAHELAHFCLVIAGHYSECIGSRTYARKPSTLVYYPPDVSHAEEHGKDGRHFLVELDPGTLNHLRTCGIKLDEPLKFEFDDSMNLAFRMYREFKERDEYSSLALESIATELLVHGARYKTLRSEKVAPRWLKQAKELLDENYANPPGLEDLARAANVHSTHLARVFRRFEGCTAGDYIRRIRIRRAKEAMLDTDKPLVEIALEIGFSDQSHFSRSFKRETGATPTQFRQIYRGR